MSESLFVYDLTCNVEATDLEELLVLWSSSGHHMSTPQLQQSTQLPSVDNRLRLIHARSCWFEQQRQP